ncbi:MAG: MarR family transcriptional regulator [Actinobacteria bacterium]|nr:MarR family transcriptional regulator [Actinomycetota bacterium]
MPAPEPADELGLVDSLAQTSFLVQGIVRRVAARHDLSVVQMRLLGILRDREPGIQVLAGHLELDKSSVTGLVDRAADRGLVERVADPDDGRAVRVRLTKEGRALAARGAEQVGDELSAATADLTEPQRRQLSSLLSRIASPVARRADSGTLRSPS